MNNKNKNVGRGEKTAIGERNRLTLACLELAKDRIFQKLPEEKRLELIKEVQRVGEAAANWVAAEYQSSDPRKIARLMGLKVVGEERAKVNRSKYHWEKKEIVISRKFHEKLLREVASLELSEHLLKLIVAHELFHHLEAERLGKISRRYRFKVWQFGPWVREKEIPGLSEVAAQAFTQSLLGLEISPQVFDYLTYIQFTWEK